MKIKLVVIGAALLGAVTLGAISASAGQTFKSGLYQNQIYTCANGSAIDPSGQSFGTFAVTGTQHQVVSAWVSVDNLQPYLLYRIFVTEYGHNCISPTLTAGNEVASFTTNGGGQALVHFWFWAHTGETSAWVTVQHGHVQTVRSIALPIN
jgi:hypothetical protein